MTQTMLSVTCGHAVFRATGTQDWVESQFDDFLRLVFGPRKMIYGDLYG